MPEESSLQSSNVLDEYSAQTIPVHVDLDVKQTVLELSEAEALLRTARSIALGPCTCRQTEQNCDAPIDTCLNLDATADLAVEEIEGFRYVNVEIALDVLRASHKAGLVHLAFRRPGTKVTEFCSCCSCCCWFLTRLGKAADPEALSPSTFVASHRVDRCIACGACVSKCAFGAWQCPEEGAKPELDRSKCMGCGVCVTACPSGAIAFDPRAKD